MSWQADTALHSKPHWKVRATKFLGTRRNEGPNKGGAWEAYSAGHRVAIKYAAQNKGDRDGLSRALAMNACASHFLSDLFAPGHLRTPRWFIDGLMARRAQSRHAGRAAEIRMAASTIEKLDLAPRGRF